MRASTRRRFLRLAALGAATNLSRLTMMNALAQESGDYKALVCVFLFGGNDSDNNVVPLDGQGAVDYLAERGSLAVNASSQPIGSTSQTPYGLTTYGLHPSLAGLYSLAGQGRLAVAANVGTLVKPITKEQYQQGTEPLPTRLFSHSDQVAQMQSARPIVPSASGWGGRTADAVGGLNAPSIFPTAVSFSGSSLLLEGENSTPASLRTGYSLSLLGSTSSNAPARAQSLQELLDFDTGFALVQRANQTLTDGLEIGLLIHDALATSGPLATVFPTSSLGRQLEEVAKLVQVRQALGMRRQIFFCSLGGFDTHSNQLARHVGLLGDLDASLSAFYAATEEMAVANEVTTFTESDFSRTFQPNTNAGTDHGWGGFQYALGGAVQGGLYGTFPLLDKTGPDSTDSRGRWIPTTSLDQYGATLARWFGVSETDLSTVFPNIANFPSSDMGFMG